MTGEEWEQIKVADRHAARREWHADPGFSRAFFATWGPGEGAALHLEESVPLAREDEPQWVPGEDPRPAELD